MLGVINYDGQLSVQWSQVSAQDYSEGLLFFFTYI